jgi:hypothetical protein
VAGLRGLPSVPGDNPWHMRQPVETTIGATLSRAGRSFGHIDLPPVPRTRRISIKSCPRYHVIHDRLRDAIGDSHFQVHIFSVNGTINPLAQGFPVRSGPFSPGIPWF